MLLAGIKLKATTEKAADKDPYKNGERFKSPLGI
jgi:hypothetical protein